MTRAARRATLIVTALAALLVGLLWSGPELHAPAHPRQTSLRDSVRGAASRARADSTPLVAPVIIDTNEGSAPVPNSSGLIIPVAGVKSSQLTDTYTAARAGGRVHDAIDIMAGHNTPVLAAAAGVVKRLFLSKRGGITIYELSLDSHTVYYYAHLDHYAAGIEQGTVLRQGQLIGYVGDTGDAGPGNYHLHFAIWTIADPRNFWDGHNINPYPLLLGGKTP